MNIPKPNSEVQSTHLEYHLVWPKWLIGVIVLAILCILVSGTWFYYSQKIRIENAAKESLESIVELKINQIVRWRKERLADANLVRYTPYATRRALDAIEQPKSQQTRSMFTGWLTPLLSSAPYRRALLMDSNLVVRLAFPENCTTELCGESYEAALRAMRTRMVAITDLHRLPSETSIHMDLLIPMVVRRERSGDNVPAAGLPPSVTDRSAGVLLLEIRAQDYLYPLIQSWPTPSPTAETVLVRKESNSVLFLSELQYRTNAALNLQLPLDQTNVPAVMAIHKESGVVWGKDYRNVPVLAAFKAIPNTTWHLLGKIDSSEIYSEWKFQSILLLSLIFAALVMVAAGATIVNQKFLKMQFTLDLEKRLLAEAELMTRTRQQTAIASLGRLALDESNLDSFLIKTVTTVSTILNVELCSILELTLDGKNLKLIAGFGWKSGLDAPIVFDAGPDFLTGYTLKAKTPIVVDDLRSEKRFNPSSLLVVNNAISGISITIPGKNSPFGILDAYSTQIRRFISHDISFMEAVANLVGAAIQRRMLEGQLRQQQKLESIGILASGVAHEINNPVNGVINYAQLILEKPDSGHSKFAEAIIHESKRVTTIVRNLLQFARHEKQTYLPVTIDEILAGTLSLIRALMKHDQITLDVKKTDPLPLVKCQSQQIQQVLMNLLTNARDALNEKYPQSHMDKIIRISCSSFLRETQTWLRIIVEDHGCGISENVSQRIFDPFFTTKSPERGTGLGLSISHGIVQEHGGELRFESEVGQWTRFYLELPGINSSTSEKNL